MSNMNYCRFENTASDLSDCIEAINDNEYHKKELTSYERNGLASLLDYAKEILDMEEEIEEIINYKEKEL